MWPVIQQSQRFFLELQGLGLTWNYLQDNRPVKQKPEIVPLEIVVMQA